MEGCSGPEGIGGGGGGGGQGRGDREANADLGALGGLYAGAFG